MKPKTLITKKTGSLLVALLLCLMACDKQGPMGPEGPPGPDGPDGDNGGGGTGVATNITTFISAQGTNFEWEGIDGWGGYGVARLKGGSRKLPDSLAEAIDQGAALVYFISSEYDQWRLPFLTGHDKEEIYDCAFEGTSFNIEAKSKSDDPGYTPARLKIVIAAPTEVHTLKLTN
jgi:hypothetical protein